MRRTIAASLSAAVVAAFAGCASTMVPESTQHDDAGISSSSQGVVTLIGRVGSDAVRHDAERIARAIKGVSDVNNELRVGTLGP